MNISNVSHYKLSSNDGFFLYFTIDGNRYNLHTIVRGDGKFCPTDVYHLASSTTCTYCTKGSAKCPGLTEKRIEVFHRLIEHPSIRLEWLYIDHV